MEEQNTETWTERADKVIDLLQVFLKNQPKILARRLLSETDSQRPRKHRRADQFDVTTLIL
jgi:hypothetical protein